MYVKTALKYPEVPALNKKLLNVPFRVFCYMEDIKCTHSHYHTHIYRSTYSIFLCDTHSTTMKKSAPKGPARYNHPRVLTLLSLVCARRVYSCRRLCGIASGTLHPFNTLCVLYLSFSCLGCPSLSFRVD